MKAPFISLLLFVTIFGLGPDSFGQAKSNRFNLKECIDYAIINHTSMKNAQLDQKSARAKVGEIRSVGLPQISASANVLDNPELKRLFFEATPSNPFTGQMIQAGMVQDGDVVAFPNFFQLRTNGDANLTATQLLFSGSYVVGLKAAKAYNELASMQTQASRVNLIENVSKAYYGALINKERLKLIDINQARLDSTIRQVKAMNQNGFVENIEVKRLEVAYNNLLTEKSKIENIDKTLNALLKFQIGMDQSEGLELSETISSIKIDSSFTRSEKIEYSTRPEYGLLQSQKRLMELDIQNVKAGYLPTLAAFGTIGLTNSHKSVDKLLSSKWYGYGYLGVSLNVPIFDGLTKIYKYQQSKVNYDKVQNNMRQFEQAVDFQVRSSDNSLRNSLYSLQIQRKNMDLAEEVVRVTRLKYLQGVGTNLELVSAESALKEAQINYYSAFFDALVSRLEYDKALGNIR